MSYIEPARPDINGSANARPEIASDQPDRHSKLRQKGHSGTNAAAKQRAAEAAVKPLLSNGLRFKPDSRLYGTIFASEFAKAQLRLEWDGLDHLAEEIRQAGAATKSDLPWIKLAWFGDTPTDKGCLRHNANVEWFDGIECDIDGLGAGMTDAADKLSGIKCLLYATPSSTAEKPHYRVLCPLSGIYAGPTEALETLRSLLVARVNGILGGILAGESFTLSQSFYFGNVAGKPPVEVIVTKSESPIDRMHHLDASALYKKGSNEPPTPQARRAAPPGMTENDDNPRLLAEGRCRVRSHVARYGVGSDPRGQRAHELANWLGDMRTSNGSILSVTGIIELMQEGDYGGIAEDILDRRENDRGCDLVLSPSETFGPSHVSLEATIADLNKGGVATEAPQWGDPADLFCDTITLPALSRDMLPTVITNYAFDVARRNGVDPALVACSMLAACATAFDDKNQIQPKRHDTEFVDSARLNFTLLAPSGYNKSRPVSLALKPLHQMEMEWANEDNKKRAEWEEAEHRRKAALEGQRRAIINHGPDEWGGSIPAATAKPRTRKIVTNAPTAEGVCSCPRR